VTGVQTCALPILKEVIEEKIKVEMEVTRRQGRRRKKLLDDLKDRRGQEAALDICHVKQWHNTRPTKGNTNIIIAFLPTYFHNK
jgi:hypothetical protein